MTNKLRILLLEDSDSDASLIDFELKKSHLDYVISRAETQEEYLTLLLQIEPDLILSDFNLTDFDGLEALDIAKKNSHETPFILVTGNLDEETAVNCIKLGAWDYILKDKLKRLVPAIENALKLKEEIREKNQALHNLKRSEAKYQDLYDNAPDMFFSVDPRTWLVINCNKTLLRELGYHWDEFVGNEIFTFFTNESREYAKNIIFPDFIQTGITRGAELQVVKKDESIIYVWLTNSAVYNNTGQIAYSRSIWRDITEQKKIEEELKAERISLSEKVKERTADLSQLNARLEKALRMKDEFLANMSHELRTPLNAILGLSEVLQDEVYGPLNQNQMKSIKTVEESGRHLLSLINDILDIAKIEAGKVELEMHEVSLLNLAQSSLSFIKQVASKKNIKYSLKYEVRSDIVLADERRLKQILINLLSNAVKFTPGDKEIGLDVFEDEPNHCLNFTVWDKGIGIKPEDIPNLFKPFEQIDSSLAREYAGTGLGLSLVKSLTAMHGGSVTVESEFGIGSSFKIAIPLLIKDSLNEMSFQEKQKERNISNDVKITDENPVINNSGQKALILLVEDNEVNIDMLINYLPIYNFNIIVARNNEEAILLAHQNFPDIILMDIQMPGKDGIETTKMLRKSTDLRVAKVPIIALTALAMPGDMQKCYDAGINEYMKKPLSLKNLVVKIRDLISLNLSK